MADAQKGHKSWIDRLDQPSDAEARDSSGPESGAAPAPVSEQGGDAESEPTTWHEYLDSSPEPTPTPFRRPDSGSSSHETGQSQQPAPHPNITELQRRWLYTQAQLLDDPKEAALEAGRLIGAAMRLASHTVDEQRKRIEREWRTDADVDTDELRSVMQRYRSHFQYVLAADALVAEVEAVRREHKAAAAAHAHAPPQDGLAEVLQPGRVARQSTGAQDHHRSERVGRATQWIAGLGTLWNRGRGTRWVAGAALLLLVGLPAAYGWWRWQQPGSGDTAEQARVLTVEPLRYAWYERSSPGLAPQVNQESDAIVGAGTETGSGAPATSTQSLQPEATRPPAENPGPSVEEPTRAAQPGEDQSTIQRAEREPEAATPEPQTTNPTTEAATLTDAETPQTEPETLLTETEPAAQESTRTPVGEATGAAQQATSTPLESVDLSQIQPVGGEPEPTPTESQPAATPPEAAAVTAAEDAPSVRQTPPAVRDPEPQPAAREPAVRRGDLVRISDPTVVRPELTVAPRADYPVAARRLRREATVELRVLVDERGMPSQIQETGQSAGLGFDEAARVAVERARWRPATKDGVPVKVWIQTAVRFQLDGR